MWLKEEKIAKAALPGQFLMIYCQDKSKLLPRPISICETDPREGKLRIVYRTVGEGTKEFATYQAGMAVKVMGPLGNGFSLTDKKAFLIGGGIGIPPMLELAKRLRCEKEIILGYRSSRELFLEEELKQYGKVTISTDDGSIGIKGTVLDAIEQKQLKADLIYACGPIPMLRALQTYAIERGIEAQLSLEERMACGIGACLACVCQSKEVDEHSHVHNKRVCKDGPVFDAREVVL